MVYVIIIMFIVLGIYQIFENLLNGTYSRQLKVNKAIKIYKKAHKAKRNELYHKAISLYKKAIKYDRLHDLDMDNDTGYLNMGEIYYELQDYKSAIKLYESILDDHPILFSIKAGPRILKSIIANCFILSKQYKNAIKYAKEAIKEHPVNPQGYRSLGTAYCEMGDESKAKKLYIYAAKLGDWGLQQHLKKEDIDWGKEAITYKKFKLPEEWGDAQIDFVVSLIDVYDMF